MSNISKEKFKEIIEFIKTKDTQQNNFCSILEEMSPETYVDAFIYADYESKLVELLQLLINDPQDDIGYFLYEFNPDNPPVDDENKPLYTNVDELYQYLISREDNIK